jgi:phage RecT family recombinase
MAIQPRNIVNNSNSRMPSFSNKPQSLGELNTVLTRMGAEFARLSPNFNPDRMTRIVLTLFSKNPKLLECDYTSIVSSIMGAAQLNLDFSLDEAFLVPYQNRKTKRYTCTMIRGWQGTVKLIQQTGIASIEARIVYKGDDFNYSYGTNQYINHVPKGLETDANITHAYAIGTLSGRERPLIEVMTIDQIKAHRDRYNKQGNDHYSFTNLAAYAKKVPLLRLSKLLPKSVERPITIELEGQKMLPNFDDADEIILNDSQDSDSATTNETPDLMTKKQIMQAIEASPQDAMDYTVDLIISHLSESDQNEIKSFANSAFDSYNNTR